MADSIIGALRVLLNLDTVAFSTGVKDAEKGVNKLDSAIKNATGGLAGLKGVLGALSAGALVAFIKSSVKVGEEIEKASDRLGISKQAYQELTYAADIAGVSHETLVNVLGKFQKGLGKTSENVTETQKGLGQLGLTLDDIKKKSPDEQFKLLADRLSAINDPARRAAIEIQLFGRAGAELDVLFRLGASGLTKLADEARRFGVILSDETIDKASKADDEFDRMGTVLKAAGVKMAAEFLPAIEAVRKAFTSQEFQDGITKVAAGIASLIKNLTENSQVTLTVLAALAAARFGLILGPIGAVTAGLAAGVATWEATRSAVSKTENELTAAKSRMEELKGMIDALGLSLDRGEIDGDEYAKTVAEWGKEYNQVAATIDPLTQKLDGLKAGVDNLKVTINKKPNLGEIIDPRVGQEIDKLKFQTELLKGSFDALPAGFPAIVNGFGLLKDSAGKFMTTIDQLPTELQMLAQQFAVTDTWKLKDELLSSWDKLNEKIQKTLSLQALLPAGSEAAAQGIKNLNKLYQNQMDLQLGAVQQGVSGFAQLAAAFGKNNKTMATAAKAFGIAEVIISTARAVMKAYAELGPIFGSVAAAGMVAAGAAQIAKISSQSFAMGGSFMVPGGTSGTDNTFVPLNLASGEQVDITPANQMPGGTTTLVVQGINAKDYYKGDVLRDIINNINTAIADGVKLKVMPA